LFALTILGCNSAIPAFGRNPTAQLFQTQDQSFLIDCGEGTQLQVSRYKLRLSKLSHILISHLHGDHYFGLIGLLSSMGLLGRTQELHIHAPEPLKRIILAQFEAADVDLPYIIHFHAIKEEGMIIDAKRVQIQCFKVQHRIECWGFLFTEKKNPRKVDPEKVKEKEIPASFYEQLQKGADYIQKDGTKILNADVTIDASAPRSYAYCADTLFDATLAEKLKGTHVIYHETTYLKDQEEKARQRYHSTTTQAANFAKIAGAKKLIIGHYSSKYEHIDAFLTETKAVFENTEAAIEGTCYYL
jgi:ribonuclease Z